MTHNDYTIGLSARVKEIHQPQELVAAINRTLSGDPGDGHNDDLNAVMELVSADMDGQPSCRFFGIPPFAVMLRPKDRHALIIDCREADTDELREAIKVFGFDSKTLKSL